MKFSQWTDSEFYKSAIFNAFELKCDNWDFLTEANVYF